MNSRAWQATVHGVAELDMTERLSTHTALMFFLSSQSNDLIFSNRNLHGFIHPHRTSRKEPLLRGTAPTSAILCHITATPNSCQSHTWALWGRMSWWFSHIHSSLGWIVVRLHITCSSEQWSSNSPSDPSGEFLPVPCPGPIPDQIHQELWEWLSCQYC